MDIKDIRNIQEAYKEVVVNEGFKKFPFKKVAKKINTMYDDPDTDIRFGKDAKRRNEMMRVDSHMRGEVHPLIRAHSPKKSKAKEAENRRRGTQKEEVDIYDIILSHLLDEGYADNQESAEVMMVNMSEEWRDSIVEAKKPLPISKMKKKEDKLLDSPEATEKYSKALKTPMGSPERKAFHKDMQRWNDIHDTRRSISTRGGKRQLPMPEVGRFKPKYDED
jgi:hypothetical protein